MTLRTAFSSFAFLALLASPSAQAAEVGDTVPCVDLQVLKTDGTVEEQCLTARANPDQFLLLDFMQTTCGYCIANLPNIKNLVETLGASAIVKTVALDRNVDIVKNFVAARRDLIINNVALDNQRIATRAYGITGTPTLFLVDANNTVVFKHMGTLGDAEMAEIHRLVGH